MKKERKTRAYQEFLEQFQAYTVKVTEGWGAKVQFKQADEAAGEPEDLLIVELGGGGPGTHIQRFHVEDIYEELERGKDWDCLMKEAADCLERCREIGRNSPLMNMEHYEIIKKSLVIRPLNYKRNEKKLKEGICEIIGDIALTLYVNIGNFGGLYTSSMVPASVFKGWGKDREQVLSEAKKNTYELFPPRLFNWLDIGRFGEEGYGVFMERDDEVKLEGGSCATFVTTENQINGAVAIFLPGVASRLGDLLGNDYYIAFTSMHEAAIHDSSRVYPETIRESLRSLNRELPSQDDFLSDRVYYYNRAKDRIEIVLEES